MKRARTAGGILAITLFISVALVWTTLLVADVGRAAVGRQKAQDAADASVLSSVRLRAEALETIAERWNEFGALFGNVLPSGEVELPASAWTTVAEKADALKRALPGYLGRTTAVIKVVAEANGFDRADVDVIDAAGAQLGLTAQPVTVRDELGRSAVINAAWYARQWAADRRLAFSVPPGTHEVQIRIPDFNNSGWTSSTRASASVRWDITPDDAAVTAAGDGGFPRAAAEAVWAGRLDPNRWPVFRADLEASVP